LGDAAAWPVQSFVKHYRHEFQYMVEHKGRSIVDGAGAAAAADAAAVAHRVHPMSEDLVNIEVNGVR